MKNSELRLGAMNSFERVGASEPEISTLMQIASARISMHGPNSRPSQHDGSFDKVS